MAKYIKFDPTDLLDEMLEDLIDAGIVITKHPLGDLYIDANYVSKNYGEE